MIRDELTAIKEAYGDARRTEIVADQADVTIEDLIERQDVVVTLSHAGYAKTQPVTDYQAQRRGGKGKMATTVKDEDFVDKLFIAHTHDTLLCFTDGGQCYWLKVYQLPLAGRGSRGKPIVNLLPLAEGERITAVLAIREFDESHFVFMATRQARSRRRRSRRFRVRARTASSRRRSTTADCLVGVALTDGQRDILLFDDGRQGNAVRRGPGAPDGPRGRRRARHQAERRPARDVADRGRRRRRSSRCPSAATASARRWSDFPRHGRAGQGVIALQTSERNGVAGRRPAGPAATTR